MDPESPDFVHQVATRLGVSDAEALAVLGSWLASYEPLEPAKTFARRRGRGFALGLSGEADHVRLSSR